MPFVERVEYLERGGVVIGMRGCRVLVGEAGQMGEGGGKRGEGRMIGDTKSDGAGWGGGIGGG